MAKKKSNFEQVIALKNLNPAQFVGENNSRIKFIRDTAPKVKIHVYADKSNVKLMSDKEEDFIVAQKVVTDFVTCLQNNDKIKEVDFKKCIADTLEELKKSTPKPVPKPVVYETETIINGEANKGENKAFISGFFNDEKNQWLLGKLSGYAGLQFKPHRSKVTLISNEASLEATTKRDKVTEIIKIGFDLKKNKKYITEKHLESLLNDKVAEKPIAEVKTVIRNNGNVEPKKIKKHAQQVNVDLISGGVIQELFDQNERKYVNALQNIFDVRISHEKDTEVSVRPSGRPTRKPGEAKHNKLLVTQACGVLVELAKHSADHVILNDKLVAQLALSQVAGAANEEKTHSRVLKQLGRFTYPELAPGNVSNEAESQVSSEKKQKHVFLAGDFGDKFVKDTMIIGLFKRKLMMEMSYYGKEGKRLTLTKKKDCPHDFALAEQVVLYGQEKYNDMQGSLNPALIENAIDNVLNDRPVGFIDEEKRSDLVTSNRREQYKLSTYNKSGENINMYPKTESQYEISDLLMGKPTKDQKSAFYNSTAKVSMLIGPAASGKTSWSIWNAVHAFKQGWIENVYLCRPDVMKQAPLPGDLKTKTAMAMAPLYENLEKVMPATESAKWIREPVPPGTLPTPVQGRDPTDRRKIEINSVPMMRGRTIENGIMIVDEAQNCTYTEIKTLMTRVGKGGSVIFSFDLEQIDLPIKRQSGALNAIIATYEAQKRSKPPKYMKMIACNGNLRHEVVDEVLDVFHAFETNGEETTREQRLYTVDNQYEQALKIYWGTTDAQKIEQLRENEKKYGIETTGYAPHRANTREGNLINFQDAKSEMLLGKFAIALVAELKNQKIISAPAING